MRTLFILIAFISISPSYIPVITEPVCDNILVEPQPISLGCFLWDKTSENDFTRPERFFANHYPNAVRVFEKYNVPIAITLAQAAVESGYGKGKLATEANALFCIKCHKKWTGKTYWKKDDDFDEEGNKIYSCFRKYKTQAQSFDDYGRYLQKKRYKNCFQAKSLKQFARELKRAGYATDSRYVNKLMHVIEKYSLDKAQGFYNAAKEYEEHICYKETITEFKIIN